MLYRASNLWRIEIRGVVNAHDRHTAFTHVLNVSYFMKRPKTNLSEILVIQWLCLLCAKQFIRYLKRTANNDIYTAEKTITGGGRNFIDAHIHLIITNRFQ